MAQSQVGVVKELFRYPVKSMLGERLTEVEIGLKGIIGDRAWALRELNGRIVSAKKWANMLGFRASYESTPEPGQLAPVKITLPDSSSVHADDPSASDIISSYLGRPVKLERARTDEHSRAEIDPATVFGDVGVANVTPGFTEATLPDTFGLPHGTFFDSAMIHVVATGTLEHMRSLIGADAQIDPRRFRPNIVIETDPRLTGFVEDEWLGGTLEAGVAVKIVAMQQALRCVMTTHQQSELVRDLRILRAAAKHHNAKVGVFASIGAPGKVHVGDPVCLAR
ncbi:MAG: MOSC domain-containing protein [Deltaproteobacteria bacterium]|nr:MOSC domain-containing protein [Deltaproteobacteria bacterium]